MKRQLNKQGYTIFWPWGFYEMEVKRLSLKNMAFSKAAIGSGASVGREGPIIQIGASIGSTIGQLFQTSGIRIKTLVGCGAAGGIAAVRSGAHGIFASRQVVRPGARSALPGPGILHRRGHCRVREPGIGDEIPGRPGE